MSAKRSVSVRQLELLVKFMESHNDLAHGRVRSKEGRAIALKLWQRCAKILNAEDAANARTAKEWNKFYNDYKCRMKTKARIFSRSLSRTGKPPSNVSPLSPLEERLIAIIGEDKSENLPVQHNPIKIELENIEKPQEDIETSVDEVEDNDVKHHQESELGKTNIAIIEIEKEKLVLQRQLLSVESEKAVALTSLANAAWALVNAFKNQSEHIKEEYRDEF